MLLSLRAENIRAYDVYLTPIDEQHHYLVVDDVRAQRLLELRNCGFEACLVQKSSADNFQVVLKVQKIGIDQEQSVANKIVGRLNARYGDPKFSGVVHPFRLAGFSNRKPGRNNAFTELIEARNCICPVASQMLKLAAAEAAKSENRAALPAPKKKSSGRAAEAGKAGGAGVFLEERAKTMAWVERQGLSPDASKIDFRAVLAMLRAGWDPVAVEIAVLASPGLADRHPDIIDYARRTVAAALAEKGASHSDSEGEFLKAR